MVKLKPLNPYRFRTYGFPWRGGNHFELLIDGHRFFPAMISAIKDSTTNIELEMYLFESGVVASRFIRKLCEASQRGVSVRLLLDDFGAHGLAPADRQKLLASGVELKFYNPLHIGKFFNNMARDHRKLLVVDGQVAFVGGAGITDEFNPPLNPEKRWRETMVVIRGPVIADWEKLYNDVWQPRRTRTEAPSNGSKNQVQQGHMLGRVAVGRGRMFRGISKTLVRHINRAQERVWISTAYFIPSRLLRRVLRRAAGRGVDVCMLLPGPDTDHPRVRIAGRRLYTSLLKSGIRIFEFQKRVLHSKAALCDQWVSIGSSNYDRWNLRWNLEANQEVEDEIFLRQTRQMFENDFSECIEVKKQDWLIRPWQDRFAEWFWGWVELWIIRLGGGRWKD